MSRLICCFCHKETFSAPFSNGKPITKTSLLQARIFTTKSRGRPSCCRARITQPSTNFPLCTDRTGYGRTRLGSLWAGLRSRVRTKRLPPTRNVGNIRPRTPECAQRREVATWTFSLRAASDSEIRSLSRSADMYSSSQKVDQVRCNSRVNDNAWDFNSTVSHGATASERCPELSKIRQRLDLGEEKYFRKWGGKVLTWDFHPRVSHGSSRRPATSLPAE